MGRLLPGRAICLAPVRYRRVKSDMQLPLVPLGGYPSVLAYKRSRRAMLESRRRHERAICMALVRRQQQVSRTWYTRWWPVNWGWT